MMNRASIYLIRAVKQRLSVVVALLLITPFSAFAVDPIPGTRLPASGSWQGNVGVSGGVPNGTTIYTTLNPGATVSQINAAIAACPSNQVVFLSAGTYPLSGTILLAKSGVTLRGAADANGAPATILNYSGMSGGAGIVIGNANGWDISNSGNFTTVDVSSGVSRGSATLTLAATPTSLQIGQIMFISAPGSSTVTGGGWSSWFGTRPFTQVVKVTGKSGNSVTFTPAINADYLATGVQVHWRGAAYTAQRAGVENLSLTRGSGVGGHYLSFQGADECWARNVKTYSVPSSTYHCYIYASHRVEIRHCEFSHMESLSSSTYCILVVHSSGLLIEDNYFHDCPNVMPMFGMSGSVFAYNYVNDLPYNPAGWLSQIVFFHGSHSHYNLFEGNWVASHYSDSGSGSRNNLFFRERMLGWDAADGGKTGNTQCFTTEANQGNLVIAGCVMGKAGYHKYYNGSSDSIFYVDTDSSSTLVRKGNYNTVNAGVNSTEVLSVGESLVASYLYSSKPSWFGNRPWPPIDPSSPSSATITNLPAGFRAVYGMDLPLGPINRPPLVSAGGSPNSGTAPLTVAFSSTGSMDPEGAALSYSWVFGDGSTSTAANPSHVYQTDGAYVAKLTVSDGTNTATSIDLNIRVGNQPPVVAASATSLSGAAPFTTTFSSAGSIDPEGAAVTYAWAFGDGATSTLANPSHTYQTVGSFLARLTVSDGLKTATSSNLVISVVDPASTLVAAYGFDEGSGANTGDASGHGNMGVISGASWVSTGRFGKALSFTSGALVTVNDSSSLDLTASVTLEAWVYPTTLSSSWMNLIFKPNGDPGSQNPCYVLQGCTSPAQVPSLFVSSATSNLTAPSPLAINTWTHLAATYDGAIMRFYVNGVQAASRAQTGTMTTSTDALTIGGNVFSGQNWSGLIDEVRIYNRALGGTEIQADMNTAVVGTVKPPSPSNLRIVGQ